MREAAVRNDARRGASQARRDLPDLPDTGSPGDHAWENDLTDEEIPDPAEREPGDYDVTLDE